MSENDTDARVGRTTDTDRYSELTIGDDEFVVYDRENHRAWIQSTVALSVDEIQ